MQTLISWEGSLKYWGSKTGVLLTGCSALYWFYQKNPHSDLTGARPHVDSLGVGDRGQLGRDPAGLGGHGEEGGDAQRHPGRDGVLVQPEGDPGDNDQHAAGDVDGDEIVGELPLEDQLHLEAAVLPGVGDHIAVGALVLLQREPGQVEPRHYLDRVHVLPLVHQVVSGPAVCNNIIMHMIIHIMGKLFSPCPL